MRKVVRRRGAGARLAELRWSEHEETVVDQLNEAVKSGGSYVRKKAKEALSADQTRICAKDTDD